MENITTILKVKFIIANFNFGEEINLEYLEYALNQIAKR
jgi:hypothetical protein